MGANVSPTREGRRRPLTSFGGRVAALASWLVFACLPLAGCDRGTPDAADAPAERLHGTVDLTIGGSGESEDSVAFWDVRGLAMDPAGRILVADYGEKRISVFSPEGELQFAFGRRGEGPGEFQGPCCIAFAPDGRLWVADLDGFRYSVFELGADSARFDFGFRMPSPGSVRLQDYRVSWDPSGRIVHVSSAFFSGEFRLVRWLLDRSGAVERSDTLPAASRDSVPFVTLYSPDGRGSTGVGQPFGPALLRAFGPNGEQAVAISSRYAIDWLDSDFRLLRRIERPSVQGPKLSADERRRAEARLEALAKKYGLKRSAIPFGVPDRKPPLADLGFDLEGRLWARRSAAEGAELQEADVYDRDGRWVATMVWPAGIQLVTWTVRGRTGLGVAIDSLGVQRVVRLQFR